MHEMEGVHMYVMEGVCAHAENHVRNWFPGL